MSDFYRRFCPAKRSSRGSLVLLGASQLLNYQGRPVVFPAACSRRDLAIGWMGSKWLSQPREKDISVGS